MSGIWLRSPVLSSLLLSVLVLLLLLLLGFRLVFELEGVIGFCRPLLPCCWSVLVLVVLMVCLLMLDLLLVLLTL